MSDHKEVRPVGRPKSIPTPEDMRKHFFAYKANVKDNPFLVKDWVGKDAEQVNREKEKPLTFVGFENWLFEQGIISDVSDYFENKENRYEDFIPICRAIKKIIQQDQIEGGMANIYNPSITQRLNGLVEKVQQEHSGEVKGGNITVKIVKPVDDEL